MTSAQPGARRRSFCPSRRAVLTARVCCSRRHATWICRRYVAVTSPSRCRHVAVTLPSRCRDAHLEMWLTGACGETPSRRSPSRTETVTF
eukprot:2290921-Prymnesium_polylepis.1